MTTTLVFGGTFDPVHLGHIRLSVALVNLLEAATLHLVPCQIPPHRPTPSAEPWQRLAMLKLAARGEPRIRINDCELKRPGVSYTIDTLIHFRAGMAQDDSLIFVMGLDSWFNLPTWHRWQEYCEFANLLVVDRPGSERVRHNELSAWASARQVSDPHLLQDRPAGGICHVTLASWDVSATDIRERIASGKSVHGLLDPAVAGYIGDQHLYGADSRVEAGS